MPLGSHRAEWGGQSRVRRGLSPARAWQRWEALGVALRAWRECSVYCAAFASKHDRGQLASPSFPVASPLPWLQGRDRGLAQGHLPDQHAPHSALHARRPLRVPRAWRQLTHPLRGREQVCPRVGWLSLLGPTRTCALCTDFHALVLPSAPRVWPAGRTASAGLGCSLGGQLDWPGWAC